MAYAQTVSQPATIRQNAVRCPNDISLVAVTSSLQVRCNAVEKRYPPRPSATPPPAAGRGASGNTPCGFAPLLTLCHKPLSLSALRVCQCRRGRGARGGWGGGRCPNLPVLHFE